MPSTHPMRSIEALRATLATGIDPAVIDGFYRAYWVKNDDIASRDVIRGVLETAGHDAARIEEAMATAAIKDDLRTRTDDAVKRGIFGVPTWIVDGEHLYWGQDRIPFVLGAADPPRRPSRAAELPQHRVDVFWDFSSPFGYLASTQLAGLARRTGARLLEQPILLGGLFRAVGTPDVPLATFPEAKQRHVANDLARWAHKWNVPFRFPSRFPVVTVRALRVWYALPDARRADYRDAVFRALWAEDRDITTDEVLGACIGDEALAREALAKSGSDAIKAELRAATEDAAARGVFGVPTFIVDERDLYWGQDRIDLVEDALLA
jgi:2-hydroxychromene-2-carboxylate isomerase